MLYKLAIAVVSIDAALGAGAHGHERQLCGCAQHEPDHPFTIDCTDTATINSMTTRLETVCGEATSYEWGGVFSTPGTKYSWVSQAVDGGYADPEMKLVIFDSHLADKEHLLEFATAAKTLMEGTCTAVSTGGKIPVPTATGACYTLTFPTTNVMTTDFVAEVDTTGVAHVAFFTAHMPTEFERDIHYFMSTDLTTDIEPQAETDAKEYNCKFAETAGIKECAQAFFVIQAHHDYCPHDTLTRYEEELFHEWESKCIGCSIVREYNKNLRACPTIDCGDWTVAALGYNYLQEKCVAADLTYAFEWAGSFATPADTYTWVSQAATDAVDIGSGLAASGKEYADAEMIIVAYSVSVADQKSALFAMKDAADTVMQGSCPQITAACTPADTACAMPTIVPTTAGACYTIKFPDSSASLVDFMATVNTAGVANVAFFTAHLPTEFERDTHYFMSTDLATDIEPGAQLGASGGHDHGRRLLQVSNADRRSKRRMAAPGTCCQTNEQQGAWKQVVSYHDLCDYNDVPSYIEVGFHDYEASCEDYFCNLIAEGVDQTACPYTPPSPPAPPPVAEMTGVVIGIAAGAGAIILLMLICVCVMISKEKAGKPIFTSLDGPSGAPKAAA